MNRTLRLSMRLCGAMLLWQGLAGAALAQANWVPDPGFGAAANDTVRSIVVQPDGQILLGGDFAQVNGVASNRMARLGADGALDAAFDAAAAASGSVYSMAVQPDGKLLVGGTSLMVGGVPNKNIVRLGANGALDAGFDTAPNGPVHSVAVQPGGKVLMGGNFMYIGGPTAYPYLARRNADGTPDATFDVDAGANDMVKSIVLQPDGQILLGGHFSGVNGVARFRVARLSADGTLDSGFVPPDLGNPVFSLAVQPDGKVLVAGAFTGGVARLHADGSRDSGFSPGSGTNNVVNSVALQPDGKVLIGGHFTQVDGVPRGRLARLNADGSLDTTFDPGAGANGEVTHITLEGSGHLLIGGAFTQVNGVARNRIARLMPGPTIGGTVTGLTVAGLVLRNNGGDDLAVPANAANFIFATPVAPGGAYDVTVHAQPVGLLCAVTANDQGNAAANVANVQIDCVADPAVIPGGAQAIPVDAPWALALLSVLLGAVGWRRAWKLSN